MFLQISQNIVSLYNEAQKYFPHIYVDNLNSKESLVARFLVSKEVEKLYGIKNYLPKVDENGIPLFDNGIFWSISHKVNLIFIGIDDKKIGIDIETYRERDRSVLSQFEDKEYNILGGKNWNNFYIIWIAKESLIKFNKGKLDDMKDIKLIKLEIINKTIGNIYFKGKVILNYNNTCNQVFFGIKDDIFYSVCNEI